MEKAILKTLNYFDIFDYPLNPWEIHKWLLGQKATLYQVEGGLKKIEKKEKIGSFKGFYFLKGRKSLVNKRLVREKISDSHLKEVRYFSKLFKIVPFLKMVGVSGSLSMKNSDKNDDIDLFVVTKRKRLYLSRLWLLFLLEVLGKRRKKGEKGEEIVKKYCINILLDEDNLAQKDNNIYIAHEVLQMMPLWERDEMYSKYLSANEWAMKMLPNWITNFVINEKGKNKKSKRKANKTNLLNNVLNFLEYLAKSYQLKIMKKPKGKERIWEGALYFLPDDNQEKILSEYKLRIKSIA